MMRHPNPNSHQTGVTLVELMIALVVSLIVMLGVATVYSSSKRANKIQDELARLQENARFAFDIITRNVRQAGYYGTSPTIKSFLLDDPNGSSLNLTAGISGFEYTASSTAPGSDYTITSLTSTGAVSDWTAIDGDDADAAPDTLPSWLAGRVLVGNDVIRILFAAASTGVCEIDGGTFNGNSAALNTTGTCPIAKGELAFISDGLTTNLFQNVSNTAASALSRGVATGTLEPGNVNPSSDSWSVKCEAGGCRAMAARHLAYFIGQGASGEPSLFVADLSQGYGSGNIQYQELIEGVENMQVLYGMDDNPLDDNFQPARYYTASDPNLNFDNVVSVRISLLLRTPQETNRPQQATTLRLLSVDNAAGVDVTTLADRRLHKVFTTTIYLRNKALYRRDFNAEM